MSPAPSPFDQSTATVRLEWGSVGATVHPFRWRDDRATAYAASIGAELAVGRRAAGPGRASLSPALGEQTSGSQAVAGAAWRTVAHDVATALHGCASGRELDEGGFGPDVDVAAEVDTSAVVPVLVDGAFTAR